MRSFLLLIFSLVSMSSSEPDLPAGIKNHEVLAKPGDGVYSLLRRYKLDQYHCNVEEFRRLNDMEKGSSLQLGLKYKLPVLLYTYNSVSIRSTIGNEDWDKAVRIKEYNETLKDMGIRRTHFTDSKILWVPHHELFCSDSPRDEGIVKVKPKKEVERSGTVLVDDLFGTSYREFEVVDNSLRNQVFYLLTGHGGPDPGTICRDYKVTMCEDEYAYDVALRLARNLRQHGAIVEMVIQDKNDGIRDAKFLNCDSDERCANGKKLPRNQLARLNQRVAYVNHKYKKHKAAGRIDQKVISIHVDSNSKSHKQDVFFCYFKGSSSSKKLAHNVRETFKQKYKQYQANRGYRGVVQARPFYVLKNTIPPAILIELANIKNKHDHKRILLESNRQALANWIFEGITKDGKSGSNQVVASS